MAAKKRRYESLAGQPGKTFGAWTILEDLGYADWTRNRRWRVRCVCGKEGIRAARAVSRGLSASCGCLRGHRHRIAMISDCAKCASILSMLKGLLQAGKQSFSPAADYRHGIVKAIEFIEDSPAHPSNAELSAPRSDGDEVIRDHNAETHD